MPGDLGYCLQSTGALPNRDFSALNYPCHLGKTEPFQATWISSSHGGSWEVAKSQDSEWSWVAEASNYATTWSLPFSPDARICIPWHGAGMGVMSPSRDQLWAVSTLLPMLALGKMSGNSHPMSHKAPRGAGWRRARKTELERAAQGVKLRTEGSPGWLLPLVPSPKTGACVVSHGTGSVNGKDQAMEAHPLPPCCRHIGNGAAAPRSSEGTGTGGGDQ